MTTSRSFEMLDVQELTMDVENPRIARIIEQYGPEPSAEAINMALGSEAPRKNVRDHFSEST